MLVARSWLTICPIEADVASYEKYNAGEEEIETALELELYDKGVINTSSGWLQVGMRLQLLLDDLETENSVLERLSAYAESLMRGHNMRQAGN